jgi:hypothetical protein
MRHPISKLGLRKQKKNIIGNGEIAKKNKSPEISNKNLRPSNIFFQDPSGLGSSSLPQQVQANLTYFQTRKPEIAKPEREILDQNNGHKVVNNTSNFQKSLSILEKDDSSIKPQGLQIFHLP